MTSFNPFAAIDHLDVDFELPEPPATLARIDHWYNRLTEFQRVGVALLSMLFLAASSLYCLGLGSTVLVNRAEADMAAREAEMAASMPTPVPTAIPIEPTPLPRQVVTATPVPRATAAPAQPTQVAALPTPIPAQLLPTASNPPAQQRPVAPSEAPRPRIVAPYEPPTPTPPGGA